jgi:hypothetical protein
VDRVGERRDPRLEREERPGGHADAHAPGRPDELELQGLSDGRHARELRRAQLDKVVSHFSEGRPQASSGLRNIGITPRSTLPRVAEVTRLQQREGYADLKP